MTEFASLGAAGDELPAWAQRRLERERAARKSAESLLTAKSRELFDAAQQAKDAERRLQLALWASGEGIWEWSASTQSLEVRGLHVDGEPSTPASLTMAHLLARIHVDDREPLRLAWRLHASGARDDIDTAFRLQREQDVRWLRIRGRALTRDAEGAPLAVTGTVKDVTDQREAEHSLQLMAQAFGSTLDALAVVDENWRIVQGSLQKTEN